MVHVLVFLVVEIEELLGPSCGVCHSQLRELIPSTRTSLLTSDIDLHTVDDVQREDVRILEEIVQ
jgi:hypothetical protein